MRNVFDQYSHSENRITHALATALAEDQKLLRAFVRWATGCSAPSKKLCIVEQRLPGEAEQTEEEAERRGLPDAWIYTDDGWCLLIESKAGTALRNDQLRRHRRTAERRGFDRITVLALDVIRSRNDLHDDVEFRQWHEVYAWLKSRIGSSYWAGKAAQYLEIVESRMVGEGTLKNGTLTTFSGIPFGSEEPYNYLEAKRVLKLALEELRKNKRLIQQTGIDPKLEGRPGITGKDGASVWDFLRMKQSKGELFTKHPHFTLGISSERLLVIVTVPHGIRTEYRRNLLKLGFEGFHELMGEINARLVKALKSAPGSAPWCEVVQRRYPTQRSAAIHDARIEFDLRTAFSGRGASNKVRLQPQWLDAAYGAIAKKRSNLQMAVGATFPYHYCDATQRPDIVETVAAVWIACKPLVDALLKDPR